MSRRRRFYARFGVRTVRTRACTIRALRALGYRWELKPSRQCDVEWLLSAPRDLSGVRSCVRWHGTREKAQLVAPVRCLKKSVGLLIEPTVRVVIQQANATMAEFRQIAEVDLVLHWEGWFFSPGPGGDAKTRRRDRRAVIRLMEQARREAAALKAEMAGVTP